jgi:subtilisin family serine protease
MRTSTALRHVPAPALASPIITAAALALTLGACSDAPVGPPHAAPRSSAPWSGGAEPTHLGIAPAGGPDLVPRGAPAGSVIPGQYVVVLKDDATDAAGRAIDPAAVATRMVAARGGTLRYAYTSAIKGFAATLSDQAVAELRRDPGVAYVEPDRVVRATTTQRMDMFGQPWGLDRIDERTAPGSWSFTYTYTRTGAGVRAYIFDTGVRTSHPEFGGRALNVYDAFGGTGDDCHGHGTHVAGTVAGTTFGVAKRAQPRGVRVLDCDGSGTESGVIAALDWVRANRVDPAVANLSLGAPFMAALNAAVTNLVNSGVFVAVAAGNDMDDACRYSPASAPAAFTAAASNWFDVVPWWTNVGPCVDIYAPGEGIRSASLTDPAGETADGTSMASPHVAGVAALVKQAFPGYSPAQITTWIKSNATRNVIVNNSPGTPDRVLYKARL